MEDFIKNIEKNLKRELKIAAQVVLNKAGVAKTTDVYKSIEFEFKNNVFVLIANDYLDYLSTGRRSGRMPPTQDLIPWMKKNNIRPRGNQTYNQLAFAIATSIKKSGVKGKNFMDGMIDTTTEIISERLSDELAEVAVDEIVKSIEDI